MDGTHTGKFSAESVRAALRRVRGSALNFVPRGIPGGRNFCPAQQAEMGSPWSVALLRHAEPRTFCSGLWLFFSFPVLPWLPGQCRQRRGTPRPCCTLPHGRPHNGSQIRSYSVSPLCPAGLAGLSGERPSPPSTDRIAEAKPYNLYFEKFFALFAIKKSRPDDMCVRSGHLFQFWAAARTGALLWVRR